MLLLVDRRRGETPELLRLEAIGEPKRRGDRGERGEGLPSRLL